ncbi:MAG: hypothetical protein EBZ36_07040 [Acidobacteria bacterium]|nr:hypothetical protein [Acidobacteriota bacterium]
MTGNTFYTNAVGGDILRGLITGSSFIIENGGRVGPLTGASTSNNEGPGFGEFYSDNFSWPAAPAPPRQFCGEDPHTEISMGALAILPGSGEVVMTAMDPRNQTAGETTQINAGGFRYLSNLNGAEARSLVLYSLGDDQSAQLGKSSGLGDIELSCGVINYLEIGNRLWADTDGDGVQDPGEPGIAGIQVTLFQGGVQVGSPVTTNSEGRYLFNTGLLPNTAYEIRVSQAQMQAMGYSSLTTADAVQGVPTDADLRDSDAVLSGGNGVIAVTTGSYGQVNHTLDMGWQPQVGASIFEIGNRIWLDADMDGIQDSGEVGIDGVTLNLYKNGVLVGQTTTAGGGLYLFNATNVTLNGAMGLLANMTYQISVATNTGPLSGLFLSPSNNDPAGDLNDSDAVAVGNNAVITVTTGPSPQNDYSFDIGFGVMRITLTDPAICLSPGGIVEILVEMGNPTGFNAPDGTGPELTIDLPSTISEVIGAAALTGSSGAGTISIVGTSQILWNGALNAGDKLTLTYQVRIGNVATNTQVCPRTTAAYDSNFDGIKDSTAVVDICMTINCPPLGAGSPMPVSSELSDQMAGSILLYNIYTSGLDPGREDTRLTITNVNPLSSTNVHLFFIDGQSCSAADLFINLTPNQTISFLASDVDPVTTGFMMAVATDVNGCPASFNFLLGGAYVKFDSGHSTGLSAAAIPSPGLIKCDPSSSSATLAFDGLAYSKLPRALALDSLMATADGNQAMLVINRLGGNRLLFDDTETAASFSLQAEGCQLRGILSSGFPRSVPRYDRLIRAGQSGWMKLWAESDSGLGGAMISFNPANRFGQGHNLHALTLTGTASYTIPVYPPQ